MALRKSTECRDKVDLPSVIPEVQCSWPGPTPPTVAPLSVQVVGTPMVVDFDFDNGPEVHPSIVFVSYEKDISSGQGTLRVIDGNDCKIQASIAGEVPFDPEVSVALGDLNGDGRPDIVAADQDRRGVAPISGVAAYEAIGNGTTDFQKLATRRQSSSTSLIKGLALHDLDDDDIPEVLTEDTVIAYNPATKTLADLVGIRQHLAENSQDSTPGLEPPVVMDIDGDLRAEMITSQGVFMWDTEAEDIKDKPDRGGKPIWNSSQSVPSTFVALANLGDFRTNLSGGTDSAEMVVVGFGGQLLVKQIDGETLLNVSKEGYSGGPPVIADFDGDGRMEFASPGRNHFTVFDLDCADDSTTPEDCGGGKATPNADAIMWSSDTQGARSGAAVFDFDGDGKAEVVYADQCFMRVYDGTTGAVLFSVPRSSTTAYEYPVVADTDGDTFSELVTTSNDDISLICPATDPENHNATVNFVKSHGVTVWKEKDDRWTGSRPIWNQHAYFVANVNDDGTIPRMTAERSSWNTARGGGPNTYRQNVQGATGFSLDKVDLTTAGVPKFDCIGTKAKVHVDVCNRGLEPVAAGTATAALIEAGNPRKVLCRLTSTAVLPPGQCVDLSCDVPITPGGALFDITIIGDSNSQLEECNEGNNQSTISGVYCAAVPQ